MTRILLIPWFGVDLSGKYVPKIDTYSAVSQQTHRCQYKRRVIPWTPHINEKYIIIK